LTEGTPSRKERISVVPAARQRLIGRESEITDLLALLNRDEVRAVTLVGPSGIGKTALAEEAIRRLRSDGGLVTEMARLPRPAGPSEIEALAFQLDDSRRAVSPLPPSPPTRRRRIVLVDGIDSSSGTAGVISRALDGDPDLTVLATSLMRLALHGEHVLRIGPLLLPPNGVRDPRRALRAPAVQMFCDCLEAADPAFRLTRDNVPTISALCSELDGHPLALQLTAQPCATLSVAKVLELLREVGPTALRGWMSNMPGHHRSLGAAIEVSWNGLSDGSKFTLRQLSVFSGPFTWEAAASVVVSRSGAKAEEGSLGANLARDLDALIDTGTVRREPHAGQALQDRFVVPGPVRRFAAELTSQEEIEGARRRHVAFFRTLARERADSLWAFSSTARSDLDADSQDLLAAFDSICAHHSTADALAFAIDLEPLWLTLGGELGARQVERLLAVLRPKDGAVLPGTDMGLVAQALVTLVVLRLWSRNPILGAPASDLIDQAIELAGAACRPDIALRAVEALVHLMVAQGRHGEACRLAEEGASSAREVGDAFGEMRLEHWLAVAENNSGNPIAALDHAIVARDLARAADDEYHMLMTSHVMAGIPGASDDPRAMPPTSDELLVVARRLGAERAEGMVLIAAALKSSIVGKTQTSASYVLDALELAQNTGAWYLEALALFVLVTVAAVSNQGRSATELHGALQDVLPMLRTRLPASVVAWYDASVARLERELGQSGFDWRIARGRALKWTEAVVFGEEVALLVDSMTLDGPVGSEVGPIASSIVTVAGLPRLSRRELQALELISTGASNKEIAFQLNLRTKTVMHYTSSLYRKLGVQSRAEAVSAGWNHGLLGRGDVDRLA
jgi:predicted ATPase/DNA-binding CsgD family transcriptional regulator